MTRILSDWITAFEEYMSESGAPPRFVSWAAVSAVAAGLQRKTWLRDELDQGMHILFPNFFILLVGLSGVGKGLTLTPLRAIIDEVERIRNAPDRATWQRLSQMLKNGHRQEKGISLHRLSGLEHNGDHYRHSSLNVISSEFSVFLSSGDEKLSEVLTKWYDAEDNWSYETKNMGWDICQNIWVNLLGGTTPTAIKESLLGHHMPKGLGPRLLFIYDDRPAGMSSSRNYTARMRELEGGLVNDLKQISTMRGAFSITPELEGLYSDWYEGARLSDPWLENIEPLIEGYKHRREIHLKKLAMVMSASRTGDMVIGAEDFSRALALLHAMEKQAPLCFSGRRQVDPGDIKEVALWVFTQSEAVNRPVRKIEITRRFGRGRPYWMVPAILDAACSPLDDKGPLLERLSYEGEECYKFIEKEGDDG